MLIQADETVELRFIDELLINLADFDVATNVLGPGRRALIWVQGCPRRCPHCITPHMQRFDIEREWISPAVLAERVLAQLPLEGITFVGGEPFSHARQLSALVQEIRKTVNLSVVTYTGHSLNRIRAVKRPDWQHLLALTDLLIDGEYLEQESCDLLWRGSANQQLHFLSPRYQRLAPYVQHARGRLLDIRYSAHGLLRVIGIPEPGFFDQLLAGLNEEGVVLTLPEPS